MRLLFIWVIDLLSNFKLHIAIFSMVGGLAASLLLGTVYLSLLFLIPLLYALLPISAWKIKAQQTLNDNVRTYRVCSFNIEWNAREHKNSLEYIKNSLADILVLQEVPHSLTGTINQYKDTFPYQYGEGHSHVMVLSKHELEFVEYLPWPGKFQKRAVHVICKFDGQAVHIFAVHFQVTRSWRELSLRNEQIVTLLDHLNNVEGAIILAGDFNAGTASNVLRKIENGSGLISEASLLNYKPTWPSRAGMLGIQLDHFYHNDIIVLTDLELGPVLDSDHRPICSKFSFYDASANFS